MRGVPANLPIGAKWWERMPSDIELGPQEVIIDNPTVNQFDANKEFVLEAKTGVSMNLGKGAAKVEDPEPTHRWVTKHRLV